MYTQGLEEKGIKDCLYTGKLHILMLTLLMCGKLEIFHYRFFFILFTLLDTYKIKSLTFTFIHYIHE
jgi:hypothetical protein